MKTAVDTSVLLDVFGAASPFADVSRQALKTAYEQGTLICCEVVWAETRASFIDSETFQKAMKTLQIQFQPIIKEATELAGKLWSVYRRHGGSRQRVIADFLIGAHALIQADQLLARDRGFYRCYFTKLKLINPSK